MTFLPCPYCGRKLTTSNLRFFDEESYLGDMEAVSDFEHIRDPRNSIWPEEWDKMDKLERARINGIYQETVEAVEDIELHCPCGASVTVNRWKTCFPDEGWLEEFEDEVNRRSVRAMVTTLNHIIDRSCGGDVRRAYQDALTALQNVRRLQMEQAEVIKMWEGEQ